MNKICILLFLLQWFGLSDSRAQQSFPTTSFSHFYFVVDSVAYNTLKKDPFCKDSLFYSQEGTAKMDQGTWKGNYLQGTQDYWEVFKPGSLELATVGSIGLGHMLHKPHEVEDLQKEWQSLNAGKIGLFAFTERDGADTSIVEVMNEKDSMLSGGKACFFVMYYHPAVLKTSGFTDRYLRDSGVDEKKLQQVWYGQRKYKRLYNKTEKIWLRLSPDEFKRHTKGLQAMGYQKTGKYSFRKEIEIIIEIDKNPESRLKKIEFSLLKPAAKREIILSPHASIQLDGNKGIFVMN